MNKESLKEFCLFSCQFEIRMVGDVVMCHLKNRHYKNGRHKLY